MGLWSINADKHCITIAYTIAVGFNVIVLKSCLKTLKVRSLISFKTMQLFYLNLHTGQSGIFIKSDSVCH